MPACDCFSYNRYCTYPPHINELLFNHTTEWVIAGTTPDALTRATEHICCLTLAEHRCLLVVSTVGLWFLVYHPGVIPLSFDRHSDGPSFDALWALVPLYTSLHGHIVPNILSRSPLCGWPRNSLYLLEEGHNHPIVRFTCLCDIVNEEFVLLSFLYIKLFELGVEVAFYNRSVVTSNKVNLLKFSRRRRSDDAYVLLI